MKSKELQECEKMKTRELERETGVKRLGRSVKLVGEKKTDSVSKRKKQETRRGGRSRHKKRRRNLMAMMIGTMEEGNEGILEMRTNWGEKYTL